MHYSNKAINFLLQNILTKHFPNSHSQWSILWQKKCLSLAWPNVGAVTGKTLNFKNKAEILRHLLVIYK